MEFQQMFASSLVSAAVHPFYYAKVLMQIGHEPLPAEPCQTLLFRKNTICYPNVLRYIGHIKKQDGFLGLYRGLGASIYSSIAGNLVSRAVTMYLLPGEEEKKEVIISMQEGDIKEQLKAFCVRTCKHSIVRCAGVVASHPLKVVMFRSMAQFVGGETQYNTIYSSVGEIYREEGILGFFSGLFPRLLGELLSIWITSLLVQGTMALYNESTVKNDNVVAYAGTVCSIMVSQFTYPFTLVSVTQAVNTPRLRAGSPPNMPIFAGWSDCWRYLRAKNQLKRGASMFFRYYNGPVILVDGKPLPAASAF